MTIGIGASVRVATIVCAFMSMCLHQPAVSKTPATASVYTDYQCPSCVRLLPRLAEIQRKYSSKVHFDFKNFPLPNHRNARAAAYAAEAAGLQGKRSVMHDKLFQNQRQWSKVADPTPLFISYAKSLGVETTKFATDLRSGKVKQIVEQDLRSGRILGVEKTPTVELNGKLFIGKDIDRLESAIQ